MDAEHKKIMERGIATGLMAFKSICAVHIFATIHGAHIMNGFKSEEQISKDYDKAQELADKFFVKLATDIGEVNEQLDSK